MIWQRKCGPRRSLSSRSGGAVVVGAGGAALRPLRLDGVFNDIADMAAFEPSAGEGMEMGFDGKTLIHPANLPVQRYFRTR